MTRLLARLLPRVLAQLLDLPPQERTADRAEDLAVEALGTLDSENRPLNKHRSAYLRMVLRSLDAYFQLEDPRKVDAIALRRGLSAPVKSSTNEPHRAEGIIDRLDIDLSKPGRPVLTIVRYSLHGTPAPEDIFQLKLQCWLLQASKEFVYDVVQGRILCLGGEGMDQVIPCEQLDVDGGARAVEGALGELRMRAKAPIEDDNFRGNVTRACRACGFRSRCSSYASAPEEVRALAAPVAVEQPAEAVAEMAIREATARSAKAAGEAARSDARASTEGVTVVTTPEEAELVVRKLMTLREEDRYHAVDTETRDWSPGMPVYGHGKIICFSIYCGDDVDFGSGPRVWVDNMDLAGNLTGVLDCFREYLEDPGIKKVFHNYSFDRAMFHNAGITVDGFAGDTMQMGRLEHSDREGFSPYSLSSLGSALVGIDWGKQSLKELMKVEGAKRPEELHLSEREETREAWIEYSTFDTVATWKLHERLMQLLSKQLWQPPDSEQPCGTLLDFYRRFWCPLGEALATMEGRGVPLDTDRLASQTTKAEKDLVVEEQAFRDWVRHEYEKRYSQDEHFADLQKGVARLNLGSPTQIRHLLFGEGALQSSGVWIGGLGLDSSGIRRTRSGHLGVGALELEALVGSDPANGKFGSAKDRLGEAGCIGLAHRIQVCSIQKALTVFLTKLPPLVSESGRLHSSFNLNTSTGRLTSANPNLQQLPALDKDIYKIREAIRCAESRRFIVADYGQLDIRILAHISKCRQMIESLRSGVDFHSGTALHMYEHIRSAVERGEVVLEHPPDGESSVPLVKDRFPTERRHAKAVNFGIAYGLTASGLSKQLECPLRDAEKMIDRWYAAYPEVREWQQRSVEQAKKLAHPHVVTLRGRWRILEDLRVYESETAGAMRRSQLDFRSRCRGWAAQRQAINAPVQGGSADVVVEAMLKAHNSEVLKRLGYSMILQVHDELVFEGPEENAGEALEAVKMLMEHPFLDSFELEVPLPVDAQITKSWGEAKG